MVPVNPRAGGVSGGGWGPFSQPHLTTPAIPTWAMFTLHHFSGCRRTLVEWCNAMQLGKPIQKEGFAKNIPYPTPPQADAFFAKWKDTEGFKLMLKSGKSYSIAGTQPCTAMVKTNSSHVFLPVKKQPMSIHNVREDPNFRNNGLT